MGRDTRGRSGSGRGPFLPALMLVAALGAGCASAGGSAGRRIPGGVASGLADRADGVAAAVDAGACDQALAEARSLQSDIAALDLAPAVRAEALAGAARLVSGISCAPPPTAPPVPPATGAPTPGKKEKGHGGHHDD